MQMLVRKPAMPGAVWGHLALASANLTLALGILTSTLGAWNDSSPSDIPAKPPALARPRAVHETPDNEAYPLSLWPRTLADLPADGAVTE
jgi:hypothetical protein